MFLKNNPFATAESIYVWVFSAVVNLITTVQQKGGSMLRILSITVLFTFTFGCADPMIAPMKINHRDGTITITTNVNRSAHPYLKLRGTFCSGHIDKSVVATMPRNGEGLHHNVDVVFFRLGRHVSDEELAKEYERRGLVSDPYAQAAVNGSYMLFADEYPNGTHWKDKGRWCSVAFYRAHGKRKVSCISYEHGWEGHWWFAGVRK